MLSYERRHFNWLFTRAHRGVGGPENLVGVPRLIFSDTDNHANVLALDTLLVSVQILAGRLANADDFLEFVAEYDLVGVGASKTITYLFGGQSLNANPWNNTLSSTQLVLTGRVYRVTATTCRSYISCTLPFLGQANPFTQFGDITVANMDTTNLTFSVTAQGTASDQITMRAAHMYLIKV